MPNSWNATCALDTLHGLLNKRGWGVQLAWRGVVSVPGNTASSDALPLQGWPFKPQSMMSPQTARGGRGTAGLRMDCISQQRGARHTLPSRHWPRRTINRPGAGFQADSKVSGHSGTRVGFPWGWKGWSRPGLWAWHSIGPLCARSVISPGFLVQTPEPSTLPMRAPFRNLGAQHHPDPSPTLLHPCSWMPTGLPPDWQPL